MALITLTCEHCNNEFTRSKRQYNPRFCSHNCRTTATSRKGFVGEKRQRANCYIDIMTENGWMSEHRYVMSQMIGRPLTEFENVHHLNTIRNDNRPENLELWVKPQLAGMRAKDLKCPCCGVSYLDATSCLSDQS
jgi:hypothetical protein